MAGGGLLDAMFRERVPRAWAPPDGAGSMRARRKTPVPRALQRVGKLFSRPRGHRLMSGAIGDDIPRPYNADWAWRPQLWRGLPDFPELSSVPNRTRLGDEITIFHDCRVSELTLHRMPGRNGRSTCALGLDVARFDGTFLSLALDLPREAIQGLKRTHLLRLNAIIEAESPMKIFARINVKHGPNTERIVRELPVPDRDLTVEFDLAYTDLNEKRIEKAWLDLIFDAPERNRIILQDLTLARRPRAAF